jgi:hypothetical protein
MRRAPGARAGGRPARRAHGTRNGARPAAGTRARALAELVVRRASGTRAAIELAWRGRGPRARIAVLAGLAVVVLLGAAAILGAAGVLGGASRPARAVAAPGTATVPGSGTRAARWLAGPAGKLLGTVSADLGRLTVAERAAGPGPARRAGLRLSADARAALLGPPPPLAKRLYLSALTELDRAGRSAANGRTRAAEASLRAGESAITKVTAVVNSPARAGAPGGPVPESAGR